MLCAWVGDAGREQGEQGETGAACQQILLVLQQEMLPLLPTEPHPRPKQLAVPGPGPALDFALNA